MWMPMRTQVNTDASGQDDASRTNAMRMPVDTESRQVDAIASRLFDAVVSRQVDAEEADWSMTTSIPAR